MKTHDELLIEARRIEALGRQYAADQRRARDDAFAPAKLPARELMAFPESRTRVAPLAGGDGEITYRRTARWVEVAMVEGALEYRLFQSESSSINSGKDAREAEPFYVMASDSAFDVLTEGYELAEKERLAEALAPFSERIGDEETINSIEPTLVEEIENIVGAEDLTPPERIHAKTDIVAFLEGRLEPSEFIAAAIERHGRRENVAERLVERHGERMLIGEP